MFWKQCIKVHRNVTAMLRDGKEVDVKDYVLNVLLITEVLCFWLLS
jgi:hypothetical protein